MSRRAVAHEHFVAVNDALSFFTGKTIPVLAEESGVPASVVKRVLAASVERGVVERKGNRYRIENASPWR